jgi:hypothetical protein
MAMAAMRSGGRWLLAWDRVESLKACDSLYWFSRNSPLGGLGFIENS